MSNFKTNSKKSTKEQTHTSGLSGKEQVKLDETNNLDHLMVRMNYWGTGSHDDDLNFSQLDSL